MSFSVHYPQLSEENIKGYASETGSALLNEGAQDDARG